jgi:hypothetical protein
MGHPPKTLASPWSSLHWLTVMIMMEIKYLAFSNGPQVATTNQFGFTKILDHVHYILVYLAEEVMK